MVLEKRCVVSSLRPRDREWESSEASASTTAIAERRALRPTPRPRRRARRRRRGADSAAGRAQGGSHRPRPCGSSRERRRRRTAPPPAMTRVVVGRRAAASAAACRTTRRGDAARSLARTTEAPLGAVAPAARRAPSAGDTSSRSSTGVARRAGPPRADVLRAPFHRAGCSSSDVVAGYRSRRRAQEARAASRSPLRPPRKLSAPASIRRAGGRRARRRRGSSAG